MPSSLGNFSNDAHRVHSYLKRALPDSQLKAKNLLSGYQPLLFMSLKQMMAAFAFSNGNTIESYNALYGSFKEYYLSQSTQLDAFDLSFVFCVPPDLPDLDQFCSKVETDVYFCRKFVVPIILPLETSFARLPFLPLAPMHGQSTRPPPAQTLLRQCGVPAILANYLAVPQQRGPEAIVKDCMEARFGDEPPALVAPAQLGASAWSPSSVAETIRLQSVMIENFRAYRKPQRFDLGADVTVLYGPNGFGKTSFFDAIDFATTGEIGRLRLGTRTSRVKFNKTAAHLDSTPQNSVVSLAFASNGAERKVVRRVSSRMRPRLDGQRFDRKTLLAKLTGRRLAVVDRVEHLVSLFRATHLFSQEHQELVKGFERTNELSELILARMLAFEDYASASRKTSSVRKIIQARTNRKQDSIHKLSREVADDKREFDRLAQIVQEHINTSTLDQAVTTLRRRVKDAGILMAPNGESDLAFARACQIAIQVRHSESQARIERLAEIANQVAGMPTVVEDLARLQEKQNRWKHKLAATEVALAPAEKEQERNELLFAKANVERSNAKARRKLLKWVTGVQPRYIQMLQRKRNSSEQLKREMSALDQLRRAESKAVNKLRVQERKAQRSRAKLDKSGATLVTLQTLVNGVKAWKADRERIAAIEAVEADLVKTLKQHRFEEKTLSSRSSKNAASQTLFRRRIDEMHQHQSDLSQLLSRLEGHVRSGSCPLCGQDHGSKRKLLSRIRDQVIEDPTTNARVELAGLQEVGERLSRMIESVRSKIDHENSTIEQLREERAELAQRIEAFESAAATLRITTETKDLTSDHLMRRYAQVREDVAEFNRLVQKDQDELAKLRSRLDNLRGRIDRSEEALANVEAAVESSQAATARLRDDPRAAQISPDEEPQRLMELESQHRGHLSEVNAAFANAKNAAENSRDKADGHRQRVKSIRSDLGTLQNEISNLKRTIAERKARLEELKFPSDADESAVLRLMDQETRTSEHLLELQNLAFSLELSIDTATTAAALRHQRRVIHQRERAIDRAKKIVQLHRSWLEYFDQLGSLVSSQQREAIANFTRQYGPRTSVIQRRLRPVYGFDKIDIRSSESTIRVRVERAGEGLQPTDYFSQSQQQTLLLSLFLTASISQTWSTFPAVFLDDPVTHFDDLNTYAFFDLILGLLDSDSRPRQFIISTCDEKILHLARQKFRHLGKKAKYYVFSSIDANGPTIDEIAPALSV